MVSRKAERITRIILREREERAREAAADAALRESALAAVRRLAEPHPAEPDDPQDYDAWFARLKSAHRRK
jgi:hypothetical protein